MRQRVEYFMLHTTTLNGLNEGNARKKLKNDYSSHAQLHSKAIFFSGGEILLT